MSGDQTTLHLPQRSADDILDERLRARVEEFNAETEPQRRVELHREIQHLRSLLKGAVAP